MTDHTKPPLTAKQMAHIERVNDRTEVAYTDIEWTPEGRQAHMHRASLIEQLDYTASVIIDLQLKRVDLKETLKVMRP